MKRYKITLKIIWATLLVTISVLYLLRPELFDVTYLQSVLNNNASVILIVYILIVLFRSLFLVPATVVLLMGLALYPNSLLFLLVINMLGILVGATLLYWAGGYLTAEDFFSQKKMKALPKIQSKINEYGFGIVLLWSFFPLVPTDLICYVSGATKMKFVRFISAVFLGEIVLVSVYLYTGKGLMDWLFG